MTDGVKVFLFSKPQPVIAFRGDDGSEVGRLDFSSDTMKFTGDAEASAKVFLDYVARMFADRFAVTEGGALDKARLDWLEKHHTLHTQVEILYVVDGYEVTLMHEDGINELSPHFRGDDLRAAIDAAMSAVSPQKTLADWQGCEDCFRVECNLAGKCMSEK